MKIMGYVRPDGKVGFRNHILVIPSSVCASEVAMRIASHIKGAVALPNQHGCCQIGADMDLTINTLIGLGKNPNVAAALVVGLGCEGVPTGKVAEEISKTGKRVEHIIIQQCGGTLKAEEAGVRIVREMAQEIAKLQREEVNISEIILAIECGGSDTTSGLASNPVAGYVSDKAIDLGGTSMFSETTELIGAEHTLVKRAVTKEVGDKILKIVRDCELKAEKMGVEITCDINYRKNLWQYPGANAKATLHKLMEYSSFIFGDQNEWEVGSSLKHIPFEAIDSSYKIDDEAYIAYFKELQKQFPRCKRMLIALRNQIASSHHTLTGALY